MENTTKSASTSRPAFEEGARLLAGLLKMYDKGGVSKQFF
jgi:hypothetical protein